MTTETTTKSELGDESLEILRAAVNIARYQNIRAAAALRHELQMRFPGRDAQIGEALDYWADYEARKSFKPVC